MKNFYRSIRFLYFIFLTTTLFCGSVTKVFSQGWERGYWVTHASNTMMDSLHPGSATCEKIIQLQDGGFLSMGNIRSIEPNKVQPRQLTYITRLNALGDSLWTKAQILSDTNIYIAECKYFFKASDESGFYAAIQYLRNDNNGGTQGFIILKINEAGDILWQSIHPLVYFFEVLATSDGGLLASNQSVSGYNITKFDTNGNTSTHQISTDYYPLHYGFGVDTDDLPVFYIETLDGTSYGYYLRKTDLSGNILWQGPFAPFTNSDYTSNFHKIKKLPNGNWVIATLTYYNSIFYKLLVITTDPSGQTLETHIIDLFTTTNNNYVNDIFFDNENNVILTEYTSKPLGQPCLGIPDCRNGLVRKIDLNGQVIWKRKFNLTSQYGQNILSGAATSDGGYIFCGASGGNCHYIKTNSLGRVYGNDLTGDLFYDEDENCLWDNQDLALWRGLVQATDEVGNKYIQSIDTAGHFEVNLPQGNYQIRLLPPHQQVGVWDTCSYQTVANFTNAEQVIFLDSTGFRPNVFCPSMQVEIGGGLFRPCTDVKFTVNYCNLGTSMAENAHIVVTLSPLFTFLNSSIPFSSQNGNVLDFPIGNIIPGQCESFDLLYNLSCEAIMGQALCAEAHIYPDSFCLPPATIWDQSNLEVEATCLGDSIQFKVKNTGIGDMGGFAEFIIIEDQVLRESGQIKLPSGLDTLIYVPNPTKPTYYFRTMQRPGHPGELLAASGIDFCGVQNGQSTLLNYPLGGSDYFIGLHCDEVRTSFDPNDKRGFPLGFGDEHIIDRNQDLQYMIRFQNTGNDTAFTVVIRDTLPTSFLDLTSLRVGSSSHPYTWSLDGQGVLSFRFDQILLPDSTSNEPASHGFVKFSISQKADLDYGSRIENRAGIYFDYNQPVLTEWSIHTVDTLQFPVTTNNPENWSATGHTSFLKITPNPFFESTNLEILGQMQDFPLKMTLSDARGVVLRQEKVFSNRFEMQRKGLSTGVYFLEIMDENGKAIFNKLIIN
jgi:uncharacterized repeat protein (TIGR01451 family)